MAEARRRIRDERGISDEVPVVITVGRQDPQKDQVTLVRAFAEVLKTVPDAQLWLVGREGGQSTEIVEAIEELDLAESVVSFGHRDDVIDLMSAADLFAFPSRWEGLGSVVVEAISVGLPIVASQLPVLAEVVGGDGSLVPVGETEVFAAEVIERLVRIERGDVSDRPIGVSARFGLVRVIEETGVLLREMIETKPMRLELVGVSGSGKPTMAPKLVKELDCDHEVVEDRQRFKDHPNRLWFDRIIGVLRSPRLSVTAMALTFRYRDRRIIGLLFLLARRSQAMQRLPARHVVVDEGPLHGLAAQLARWKGNQSQIESIAKRLGRQLSQPSAVCWVRCEPDLARKRVRRAFEMSGEKSSRFMYRDDDRDLAFRIARQYERIVPLMTSSPIMEVRSDQAVSFESIHNRLSCFGLQSNHRGRKKPAEPEEFCCDGVDDR